MPIHSAVRRRPLARLPLSLRVIAVANRRRSLSAPMPPRGGTFEYDPKTGKLRRTDQDLPTIIQAIGALDATDATLFTQDGKPKVVAVEAILGYDISEADRDAAWAIIQA